MRGLYGDQGAGVRLQRVSSIGIGDRESMRLHATSPSF